MISDRLHRIISITCFYGCKLGSFGLQYDGLKHTISYCKDEKTKRKIFVVNILACYWLISSVVITTQEFSVGTTNKFVLTLMFTVFGVIGAAISSIPKCFVEDIIILVNGVALNLRNIESK